MFSVYILPPYRHKSTGNLTFTLLNNVSSVIIHQHLLSGDKLMCSMFKRYLQANTLLGVYIEYDAER